MIVAPGTRLGCYEIRSKIGEGGMGNVCLVQATKLDRNRFEGEVGETKAAPPTVILNWIAALKKIKRCPKCNRVEEIITLERINYGPTIKTSSRCLYDQTV